MTDDDWEKQRQRSILAAFQTGRPVFGSDGVLHYVDGDREPLADDVGVPQAPLPDAMAKSTWWERFKRQFKRSTP